MTGIDYRAHGAPIAAPDTDDTPVVTPGFNAPMVPVPVGPGAVAPPPPSFGPVEVFPWWDKKWDLAQAWNTVALNFTIAAAQVAGQATLIANLSYTVPAGMRGVVKSFIMTIQNPLTTTNVQLTLFKNQGPVQGWSGIAFPPLSATAIVLPFNDVNIQLDQGDTIQAAFSELSSPSASWTASLQITGWQIVQAEIDRVQSSLKY